MITQLQGLEFETHSPSAYRLLSVRKDVDDDATVTIAFTGQKWCIRYQSARANVTRIFNSRDAAIALIADRIPT